MMWDLNKIDWENVGKADWTTKVCQADKYSKSTITPIFQIPFSEAVVTEDVTAIFDAYVDT